MNTDHKQGDISNSATIYSNDANNKQVRISIKAFVKVPILISNDSISFQGIEGQELTRTVVVTAKDEKPLKLEQKSFDLSEKMTYRLEETEPGKIFTIHFMNIPGPAESYKGILTLKTNYPDRPEIQINVKASFRKAPQKPLELNQKG